MGKFGEFVFALYAEFHLLIFHMSRVHIKFNKWDKACQEKTDELRDGYDIQVQCAITMFDATISYLQESA